MLSIKNIEEYLKGKDLKFWVIQGQESIKEEIYNIFNNIESSRTINTKAFSVTLYVDHDGYTGSSSFSIAHDLSIEDMENAVDKGVRAACLVKNKHYPIKQKKRRHYPILTISGDDISKFTRDVEKSLRDIEDVEISSTELIIKKVKRNFLNSQGSSYFSRSQSTVLDMVFLTKDGKHESQFLRSAPTLEELNIGNTISKYVRYAKDGVEAKMLKTGKYDIILAEEVLEELFNFFLFHSMGSTIYKGYSYFKRGERVFKEGRGTPLNIYCDPKIKNREILMDEVGNKVDKFPIIEDSKLANIVANTKYAHYLNVECTGPLTNVVIKGGEKTYGELIKEGTVVIERVSAFSPKEVTGDFAGEIRLGYIYINGQFQPIKGGAFSGNLKELMPDVELSKEQVRINGYIGPKGVKFFGVNVSGE